MARRRVAESHGDDFDAAIAWYREELSGPAPPPDRWLWPPVALGPSWQRSADGGWLLPEASLGWWGLGWCAVNLQHAGRPWRFTLEQARLWLWWFAVDTHGRFLYRDLILQRLKGWGKDPWGACLCAVEAFGPARFDGWDGEVPTARDVEDAWVQTAAVSLEQTKNTMRLFPGLFTEDARRRYGLQIGKEMVHGLGDRRLIQAVTSSPATLEGARSTAILKNETQHWLVNNDGHEMAAVIDRNATKSPDGSARTVSITNAYEPSEDSVAQHDREAWELASSGGSLTTGILYDSLEAPPEAPLTADAAPDVVKAIRGDSVWLNSERIVQAILDTRNPPSRSRRFWFNQVVATEDAWCAPQDFDACAAPLLVVSPSDEEVLFFDGAKSDDATGLTACRLSDGHTTTLGMWQRPPGERGAGWLVSRPAVDEAVSRAVEGRNVVALFGDPSHSLDDETQERFWDGVFDEWHRRWKDRFRVWAQPGKHAVMWDMTSPARVQEFTAAAERTLKEIEDAAQATRGGPPATPFTHDGDSRLRRHVHNARRGPNRWGVSLRKEHRESDRKIDLAVCMVGGRMVRRLVLNTTAARKRSGVVW